MSATDSVISGDENRRSPGRRRPPNARFSGAALRKWRRNRRLSIPRLARYLDYAAPTLYRWEAETLHPEHPELLRLALEHFDCRRREPRPIDQDLVERLRYWLDRIGRGSLTSPQVDALGQLRELIKGMQTTLADRSADNADTDADTPDNRGRWRLSARRIDPNA